MSGLDGLDFHAHLLHDFDAVGEAECDALLGGAQHVGLLVDVEVDAVYAGTRILVLEHTLCTVAEWDDAQAFSSDGDALGQVVHFRVADAFRCDGALHPCVEDACAVDAEQDAEAGLSVLAVVDVGEGVDAAELVVVHIAQHAIDDARCAARGSDFARLHHVERQGIVRLVAASVADGRSGGDAKFIGHNLAHTALHREGRDDVGDDALGEAEVLHHVLADAVVLEVPEHALRQAAHGRLLVAARQTQCDVVARQHDLVNLLEDFRLVLLHPSQFCCGEVARAVQQVGEALFRADGLERLVAEGDSAAVAPDDGWTERLAILIDADQTVHLIGDADGLDVGQRTASLGRYATCGLLQFVPPHFGFLLGPTGLLCDDWSLGVGILCAGHGAASLGIDQRRFHR